MDDDRRNRATANFQLCFDHYARSGRLRIRFEVFDLADQIDDLQQVFHPVTGQSRDFDGGHFSTEVFGDHPVRRQFRPHAQGVGANEIHLVDGDDHLHAGGT